MSNVELSQKEQAEIVDKLISRLDETGPEEEFDEDLYNQLDERHKMQVDDAITEFVNGAVGSDTWNSDE
ncbi:hypothetical protein LHV56_19280 [Peribacillus frigoritolerans]|uniref:hypothetical protein n=1 Tax=Peribacillus frigoritolerans TaxID=450367 RepID=UPI0020798501|nr:hypothetical protein [Peribacillus frigoritolerans]USK78974.1 hypothetical protein LHV56_19280 [Peribacillus frigoritolerans]